jgi:Tol biopolymer transport system component
LPAALFGVGLSSSAASAAVPASLLSCTVQAAAGRALPGAVPAQVAALAEGVVKAMFLTRLKTTTAALLLALVGFGAALLMAQATAAEPPGKTPVRLLAQAGNLGGRAAPNARGAPLPAGKKARTPRKGRIFVTAMLNVKRAGQDNEERFRGIIAIDPETGKWTKITGDGNRPRVSPDGETLIFVRENAVWNCDTKGADNPGKITDLGSLPLWSADGKSLVVNKGNFDKKWTHHHWRMAADGSDAKKLPIPETDEVDDWSPDGKWFVAVSDRHPPHGRGYQLYVMRPDGTEQRRLTKGGGLNVYPRFSPDSRRLVYLRQTAKEGNSIWVVDVDGTNARQIMKEEGQVTPDFACWSPDGKRLAVVRFTTERDREDADTHIEIMDADGQNRRRLNIANAKVIWLGHADWR